MTLCKWQSRETNPGRLITEAPFLTTMLGNDDEKSLSSVHFFTEHFHIYHNHIFMTLVIRAGAIFPGGPTPWCGLLLQPGQSGQCSNYMQLSALPAGLFILWREEPYLLSHHLPCDVWCHLFYMVLS